MNGKKITFLSFTSQHVCEVCTKFNDRIISCQNYNENFVKACTNFHKSAVIDHAKSEMHMKSLEHQETENPRESSQAFFTKTVAAAAGTALGDSPKKMGQTSNIQQKGIEKLLHIAYFIASKGCPYTDFSDLVELAKLHEVKSVPSGSYENETACQDFNFVPKQYLMQISGTELIAPVLLVSYAMAPQSRGLLKKNAFTCCS